MDGQKFSCPAQNFIQTLEVSPPMISFVLAFWAIFHLSYCCQKHFLHGSYQFHDPNQFLKILLIYVTPYNLWYWQISVARTLLSQSRVVSETYADTYFMCIFKNFACVPVLCPSQCGHVRAKQQFIPFGLLVYLVPRR